MIPKKVFRYDPLVFPLKLWVCFRPDLSKIKRMFDVLDENNYVDYKPITEDDIKPYWGACRLTVRHKASMDTGCLLLFMAMNEFNEGMVVHEVNHAYDEFAEILKIPFDGETRSYLTEWMTNRVYEAYRKEERG